MLKTQPYYLSPPWGILPFPLSWVIEIEHLEYRAFIWWKCLKGAILRISSIEVAHIYGVYVILIF